MGVLEVCDLMKFLCQSFAFVEFVLILLSSGRAWVPQCDAWRYHKHILSWMTLWCFKEYIPQLRLVKLHHVVKLMGSYGNAYVLCRKTKFN